MSDIRYIERDVYVRSRRVERPIDYVRGTNTLSLLFHFRDFDIPENATVRVYLMKPSGKVVYNSTTRDGNDVVVECTTQMFVEKGFVLLQIRVTQDEQALCSFVQPINVWENLTDGEAESASGNTSDFLDEYISKMDAKIEELEQSIANVDGAVESANSAAKVANDVANTVMQAAASGEYSASITIGSTTTGAAGTKASVINSGTKQDVVLDFVIPKGDKGSKGDTGEGGDNYPNLVKNGDGGCLDNSFFPGATFHAWDIGGTHPYIGSTMGYFEMPAGSSITGSQHIDLKCNPYTMPWAFSAGVITDSATSGTIGLIPYDADKQMIYSHMVPWFNRNKFYLAEDLKKGDTTVKFEDLTGWITSTTRDDQRSLLFYNYTDGRGYTWDDFTYSRNVVIDAYASDDDVNVAGGTIALSSAWTGDTVVAGTAVSQVANATNRIPLIDFTTAKGGWYVFTAKSTDFTNSSSFEKTQARRLLVASTYQLLFNANDVVYLYNIQLTQGSAIDCYQESRNSAISKNIATINSNLKPTSVTITPASDYQPIEGEVYQIGRLVVASFSICAKSGISVSIQHGLVIASGFPKPMQDSGLRIDGQCWTNGGATGLPPIRCTINDSGQLCGYYSAGTVEIINSAQPVLFNFSYISAS